jgi:hypothetical protein
VSCGEREIFFELPDNIIEIYDQVAMQHSMSRNAFIRETMVVLADEPTILANLHS